MSVLYRRKEFSVRYQLTVFHRTECKGNYLDLSREKFQQSREKLYYEKLREISLDWLSLEDGKSEACCTHGR